MKTITKKKPAVDSDFPGYFLRAACDTENTSGIQATEGNRDCALIFCGSRMGVHMVAAKCPMFGPAYQPDNVLFTTVRYQSV